MFNHPAIAVLGLRPSGAWQTWSRIAIPASETGLAVSPSPTKDGRSCQAVKIRLAANIGDESVPLAEGQLEGHRYGVAPVQRNSVMKHYSSAAASTRQMFCFEISWASRIDLVQ